MRDGRVLEGVPLVLECWFLWIEVPLCPGMVVCHSLHSLGVTLSVTSGFGSLFHGQVVLRKRSFITFTVGFINWEGSKAFNLI